jgi:hypothetical protein
MILFEAVKLFLGDVYRRLGKHGGLTMENSANKMGDKCTFNII